MDYVTDLPQKNASDLDKNLSHTQIEDQIDDGTIEALGYQQAYRRVLRTIASVCLVIALTTY
jgi:hypothetical protein